MIETERLILRQWKESDSEPFIKMGLDEDVMRFSQSFYLLLKV
ncbi:gNAT family acetyltransferase [Acinetobacter baumannii 1457504]|nr:gNAT family acetyltransferase [Acinetobacter baumannii 1457504]